MLVHFASVLGPGGLTDSNESFHALDQVTALDGGLAASAHLRRASPRYINEPTPTQT